MKSIAFIVVLMFYLQLYSFSQVSETNDSIINSGLSVVKAPVLNYSIGSHFTYIPGIGNINGMNISAFYKQQINSRLYVVGGLVAGRNFLSLKNQFDTFSSKTNFNQLSVYGSAVYKLNQRLSVYGTGTHQLLSNPAFFEIPKNSYSIGSNLDFGNFSIGAEVRFNNYDQYNSTLPFGGGNGFFPTQSW